ncbi:rop guanine nucleotide exchange factor 1-like [Punica granatum]|uniref:Rop guanine nucleotide exchange factor 1-like n=1 Tax=Punica granatum TaxID=22663 RepID=A0A218X9E2_PUNGR|nr:rop guanine nucleotide exchange factor 1-like [Punica granatum]OWM81388.1 hypothetical protein CDL15_Pgr007426 [Punica granatum]
MGSLSSDGELERFEPYSTLSADVSESESWAGSDCVGADYSPLSSTPAARRRSSGESSFPTPIPGMFPVLGGRSTSAKRQIEMMAEMVDNLEMEEEVSEVDMMKERFTKLLLGEDMSGGGKGVCTALAISNAITNLSANVFGGLWKLEPLSQKKKSVWRREMEWLLCVSDSMVEFVPSKQESPGGGTVEIMVTRPRADLHTNLPALKKLDAMLICILDAFCDSEFYYVDCGVVVAHVDDSEACPSAKSSGRSSSVWREEKRWLPFPRVPQKGLSEDTRKKLQQYRECTNQILKAAMAINGSALAEMEVPSAYLESLPKSGKACLGETIYRYMTEDKFYPELLLDYLDVSSEWTTSDIANRIEAAAQIWRQKYLRKESGHARGTKTLWGGKVKGVVGDAGKSKLLARRAETLLKNLRLRFPGLRQTALDMSKIQHNKDVGHSILESYSRLMESIAFNITARIDDVFYVDDATKQRAVMEEDDLLKRIYADPFIIQNSSHASTFRLQPWQSNRSDRSSLKYPLDQNPDGS